jgi:hypothetical protein
VRPPKKRSPPLAFTAVQLFESPQRFIDRNDVRRQLCGTPHLPAELLKGVEGVRLRLMAIVGPGLPPRMEHRAAVRRMCGQVWGTPLMQGSYASALVSPWRLANPQVREVPQVVELDPQDVGTEDFEFRYTINWMLYDSILAARLGSVSFLAAIHPSQQPIPLDAVLPRLPRV